MRLLTEEEKLAVIEYYLKQAKEWREIAIRATDAMTKEGEQRYAYAILKAEEFERQAEELEAIPEAKVTPAPEVTQIEAMARWQKMSSAERQQIALRAKMPSTLAIRDWQNLKLSEKDAITNVMPRITEGLIPKAEPVTLEVIEE